MRVLCRVCGGKATWELVWADGRAVARSCEPHKPQVAAKIAKQPHASVVGWRKIRKRKGT